MCRMEIRFFASYVRRNGLGIVSYVPRLGKTSAKLELLASESKTLFLQFAIVLHFDLYSQLTFDRQIANFPRLEF